MKVIFGFSLFLLLQIIFVSCTGSVPISNRDSFLEESPPPIIPNVPIAPDKVSESNDSSQIQQSLGYVGVTGTGNIVNGGLAAITDNGWVFFSIISNLPSGISMSQSNGVLYKARTDGSEMQLVLNGEWGIINNISIVNDWIYFTDGSVLMKARIDGSDKQWLATWSDYHRALEGVSYVNVSGDWIYYVKTSFGRTTVERIRTDNTDLEVLLVKSTRIRDLTVQGEWIYFRYNRELVGLGHSGEILARMRTDGSDKEDLLFLQSHEFSAIISYGYVFTLGSAFDKETGIHTFGVVKMRLTDEQFMDLDSEFEEHLFRHIVLVQSLDISHDVLPSVNVAGDWVYVAVGADIWSAKTDSATDLVNIIPNELGDASYSESLIFIFDKWIVHYFSVNSSLYPSVSITRRDTGISILLHDTR